MSELYPPQIESYISKIESHLYSPTRPPLPEPIRLDLHTFLADIDPSVYLPDASQRLLAKIADIDRNASGTADTLLALGTLITKDDTLTASDLESFEDMARSITPSALLSRSPKDHQNKFVYILNAIRTARELSLQSTLEPLPLSAIILKFREMLTPESEPFRGHSVGFELEFFSASSSSSDSQKREVPIGPFTTIPSAARGLECADAITALDRNGNQTNLHVNIGETEEQKKNYDEHANLYHDVLSVLAYIANSASRNIIVKNKKFAECDSFNYKSEDTNCFTDEHGRKQVGRLELKSLCLAPDADHQLLVDIVEIMWHLQDDPRHPARAEVLRRNLRWIFKAAAIDINAVPIVKNFNSDFIHGDLTEKQKIELDEYYSDFGEIDRRNNVLMGRQIIYREPIKYYLRQFLNGEEPAALRHTVIKELIIPLRRHYEKEIAPLYRDPDDIAQRRAASLQRCDW
jgi:hypothetical protein